MGLIEGGRVGQQTLAGVAIYTENGAAYVDTEEATRVHLRLGLWLQRSGATLYATADNKLALPLRDFQRFLNSNSEEK